MKELLFWLYLINMLLLILHEIDSAYWEEWKLFHLPGGEAGFLLLHIPLLLPVLYGLVLLDRGLFAGMVLSLLLGLAGVFAFSIHTIFIRRGHPEFTTVVSRGILLMTLLISLLQLGLTITLLSSTS